MQKKSNVVVGLFLCLVVGLSLFSGYVIGQGAGPNFSDYYLDQSVAPYSYMICTDGLGWYWAVNGSNGAVCWTSTNASDVARQAYTALTTSRVWYEKIVFEGNITFTNKVVLPSWSVTQIDGAIYLAAGSNCDIFTMTDVSNVEVYGGLIDGNKAAQSGTARGFLLIRTYNINIHNIYIKNTLDDAILISAAGSAAKYTKITQCTFEGISDTSNYGTPIETDTNVYYLYFGNNHIINSGWAGSDLDGCYYSEYSDNVIDGAYHMGLEISEGSSFITASRNVIRNVSSLSSGSAGLRVGGAGASTYNIKLTDNIIEYCQRDGIKFDTPGTYYIDVSGNTINNTGLWNVAGARGGISLSNVYYGTFDRNIIVGSKGYGYYLAANVNNTQIKNSFTYSNIEGCVNLVAATCGNNILTNNNFAEGNIIDAGTNTRAFLNYNPTTNVFITAINPPTDSGSDTLP